MTSANAPLQQVVTSPPERASMVAPKTCPSEVAQLLFEHVADSELGDDDPARAKRIFASMRRLRGCE